MSALLEAPPASDPPTHVEIQRKARRTSQRIAWWLLRASQLGRTVSVCARCGRFCVTWYAPNPRPAGGLELWTRCTACSWSVLQLCQPYGARRPFVPPVPWETIEAEIAAMRTNVEV